MKSRLVKLAKAILPKYAQAMIRGAILRHGLWSKYRHDADLYWRYSNTNQKQLSRMNLRAMLIAQTHCIEKGLALTRPRIGFGERQVHELVESVREYMLRYGTDWATDSALDALLSYSIFNTEGGHSNDDLSCAIQHLVEAYCRNLPEMSNVATISCMREELLEARKFDFARFVATRHSIRQFTSESVDLTLIESAVSMAQTTPSVCNRQAWRVYAYSDTEAKMRILTQQTGNRGFGEQIAVLLVVACDLQCFFNSTERNQAWVDGGMFAMSLVLALHSLGLGTCCLNWCISETMGCGKLASSGIPESDAVVMMIGVGHPPERFHVARSKRKPLEETLIIGQAGKSESHQNAVDIKSDRFDTELVIK
jgi:nitroreductase